MREQQRDLYAAIDLHSNNNYLAIVDAEDHRVFERRLKNEIGVVIAALAPFKERVAAIAVESTFNWYWLVDGLEDACLSSGLRSTSHQARSGLLRFATPLRVTSRSAAAASLLRPKSVHPPHHALRS
jgi:hypothetical protein